MVTVKFPIEFDLEKSENVDELVRLVDFIRGCAQAGEDEKVIMIRQVEARIRDIRGGPAHIVGNGSIVRGKR